jgi:hypothetical protein
MIYDTYCIYQRSSLCLVKSSSFSEICLTEPSDVTRSNEGCSLWVACSILLFLKHTPNRITSFVRPSMKIHYLFSWLFCGTVSASNTVYKNEVWWDHYEWWTWAEAILAYFQWTDWGKSQKISHDSQSPVGIGTGHLPYVTQIRYLCAKAIP